MNIDLTTEPLGTGTDGKPVYLKDIWPTRAGNPAGDAAQRDVRDVPPAVRERVRRRRALAEAAGADGRSIRSGKATRPTSASRRSSRGLSMTPAPLGGSPRRARAGGARRQHHHRSHFAGRQHQGEQPGRQVPDRARRRAQGLQLLRRAARQSRSDDARHVRQHAHQEPAGARHRRRRDGVPARRRSDADLRRGDAVPGRRRAAGRDRRQGIRIRIVARLGGEGHDAARREGRDRRELRAHPPQQPRQHGRAAAAVQGRRECGDASA